MNVLFLSRKNLLKKPGGDTIQILKTAKYLTELGIQVDICEKKENVKYDIVHIYNTYNAIETIKNIKIAKNIEGAKVVLTPIYHSLNDMDILNKSGVDLRKKIIYKFLSPNLFYSILNIAKEYSLGNFHLEKSFFSGYKKNLAYIFNNVDGIFANSNSELETIKTEINIIKSTYCTIINNGLDIEEIKNLEIDTNIERRKKKEIFCIGRIEPLKNQLGIIEAFKKSKLYNQGYHLIFCGSLNSNNKNYSKTFKKLINEDNQLVYIGQLPQSELFNRLSNSSGLIHASWFETTGLIGLEAGYFLVPVIMTNKGYTRDYFKKNVLYCNPVDIQSIVWSLDNLLDGITNEMKIELKSNIEKYYNWKYVSESQLKEYNNLIEAIF